MDTSDIRNTETQNLNQILNKILAGPIGYYVLIVLIDIENKSIASLIVYSGFGEPGYSWIPNRMIFGTQIQSVLMMSLFILEIYSAIKSKLQHITIVLISQNTIRATSQNRRES